MTILKSLGVGISIDDFGTGYSSLTYLKELPLSQLKIDQSFVKDIVQEPKNAMIVKTIISMAKHLDLKVIAEGVEDKEQVKLLIDKGCDQFQGYYFSKPKSIQGFKKYMMSQSESKILQLKHQKSM
jgi:EAL domain-containing protein (putative c-di-GMP-specific phosphodiesterase class I)